MPRFVVNLLRGTVAFFALALAGGAKAQVNVVTAHNDIARTGQNLNEVALTPSNVNPTQFGKLFSQQVIGAVYAQPLYVSQLAIPDSGTHNVVFVATAADMVYAFDADTNGGANGTPLWQTSLLTNTTSAGTFQLNWGVRGTPVIDLSSNTMYLVSSETQTAPQPQSSGCMLSTSRRVRRSLAAPSRFRPRFRVQARAAAEGF